MIRLPRLQSFLIGTLAISVLSFALFSPAAPSGESRASAAELGAPNKAAARAVSAVAALPADNLLANPSFVDRLGGSDDPAGWSFSPWGAASISVLSDASVDSDGGGLAQKGQTSWYVTWQDIPVQAGGQYRLTGWVNIPSRQDGLFKVEIVPMTKWGGVVTGATVSKIYDSGTSGWVEVALDETMDPIAAKARIQLKTEAFRGLAYADHFAFVNTAAAPVTPTQTATSTPTAKPAATLTPTTPPLAAPGAPTPTPTAAPAGETPTPTVAPTQPTATATAALGQPTATATAAPGQPTATATAAPGGPTSTPTPGSAAVATPTPTSSLAAATATPTAQGTATPVALVANDDFDAAAQVNTFPYISIVDTTLATMADDDPDMGNGAPFNSNTVWFKLVAPRTGSIRANTAGSSYDTVIAAYTGTRGNLSRLAMNDNVTGSDQASFAFNVQSGTTYYLEVAQSGDGVGGQLQLIVQSSTATVVPATATPTASATPLGGYTPTPTITPTATPSGPVPNNEIEYATLISSFTYTTSQDTSQATTADDDPDMGNGSGANSNTVWYKLVAPNSGSIRANTEGSSYDTVVAAYTGSRGNLNRIGTSDDSNGTVQSDLTFNVDQGNTYYLEIAQYGASGGGQLHLRVENSSSHVDPTATATPWVWPTAYPTIDPALYATSTTGDSYPAPANDDISAALAATLPLSDSRDTRGATVSADDPSMGAGSGTNSHTVWYRYSPTTSGNVRVNSYGSDYDTVLAVFSGSRGQLTLVASNDDAVATGQSEVVFTAKSGLTYYVELAQFGSDGGGALHVAMEATNDPVSSSPTEIANSKLSAIGTPVPTAPAAVLGITAPSVPSIPPVERSPQSATTRDNRYFSQTGFRINQDAFWDYFQKRGGIRTFGYPISWEFPLMGFKVQFFQRGILQLMPNGSVATMNLLDADLMPYNQINFSTFPASEQPLLQTAPMAGSTEYGQQAIAFLQANVPDEWEGIQVNFLQTYTTTVKYEDAFPEGGAEPALVPLLNLELWGLPTSKPAYDPRNHGFIYQRFQRGIMIYDTTTGTTQGLLLADYLKGIITGEGLPPDLDLQAQGSRFYRELDRSKPGQLSRPADLPGTNLEGAFDKAQ